MQDFHPGKHLALSLLHGFINTKHCMQHLGKIAPRSNNVRDIRHGLLDLVLSITPLELGVNTRDLLEKQRIWTPSLGWCECPVTFQYQHGSVCGFLPG